MASGNNREGTGKIMVNRPRPAQLAAFMVAMILSMAGCAREEPSTDSTSPDHIIKAPKSQGKYRFGITDSIAIEFSENIDTGALDLGFSDPTGIAYRFQSLRRLQIHGTKNTYGTPHFPVNTSFTMTMTGLKDLAGNGRTVIEETFLPYPWADRDFLDTTYDWYDTLYSGANWVDGTPVTDTLTIEGSLDDAQNFGRFDRFDYKVLRVAAPDTLDMLLTTRKDINLKVQIAGPFKAADFDSLVRLFKFEVPSTNPDGTKRLYSDSTGTKARASHQFVADLEDHKWELGSFDAAGLYVIRLRIPEEKEGFYRLSVHIRKSRLSQGP